MAPPIYAALFWWKECLRCGRDIEVVAQGVEVAREPGAGAIEIGGEFYFDVLVQPLLVFLEFREGGGEDGGLEAHDGEEDAADARRRSGGGPGRG